MMPCDLPAPERERPELPATFTGGCHCGAVRFRVTVRSYGLSDCNCSMCTKKALLHLIVPKADFELVSGGDHLSTYQFNTKVAKHHFCRTCGIHSFYVPRSHPDGFSVNARCLDGVELAWFDVEPFDGENWEAHIHTLR
jgi:hypothetical protein